MSKKFVSTTDMYKSKSRNRKSRGAAPGCMTMMLNVILIVSALTFIMFQIF